MSVVAEGIEKVQPTFDHVVELVRARVAERLEMLGEETAFLASGNAPRLSGALAGSIRARLSEGKTTLVETIKPGEFYGKILALGVVSHGSLHNKNVSITKTARAHASDRLRQMGKWRIPPNPYMKNAEDEMRDRIASQLQEATNEALAEAIK